ncbi:hypothetical protein AB0L83_29880 [Streptomyces sp. NPDC052071]|uniref:hypothetical protein n=1 Tax=Streptomyces TaxID=1883 RepID=UPI002276F1CB|nr:MULTISPECIES: hypothetical protein [unclassified Streptomyces]WSZ52674.1 hypothetical protein OG337_35320 [[Kitasatospora] papulosa]MCY1655553.1 hypothetical protein [Streptomyces sp. SL203]MCY1676968.1 hypothetical protein [Streptomyces sp. SL294]MDX3186234.1 hypothetical protein [Streptomyces sp. ME02-7008A-1]MDX3307317.1 hypothetical protein [Streptomyces sp. ME02-7008A]
MRDAALDMISDVVAAANAAELTCIAVTQASHVGKIDARGSNRQWDWAKVSVVR